MLPRDSKWGELIKQGRVQLTPLMIPKSHDFDVKDSQFFSKFTKLPSQKKFARRPNPNISQEIWGCLSNEEVLREFQRVSVSMLSASSSKIISQFRRYTGSGRRVFRSVVSSGQSTTAFATLNRSQQNHS
ncbi:hypothetical protein N7457_002112 [Penicillium paradoxum]|uniref:uncharacterized protein n=1 Tax=Penicillium paradoxum TaxID=176176 RepID=UPI00254991F9|nr:uncharacterized protein N7457_002112 [Penicillium paradoxum]KAJ5787122.1 hypothetical protein N7457_002112 [Penicillium paradoxum]